MAGEQQPEAVQTRAMCEVHGLAVGNDGHCVICRRDERRQGEQLPLLPILGVVAALIFVGLIVFAVIRYGGLGGQDAVAVAEPSTAMPEEATADDEEADGTERPRQTKRNWMADPRSDPRTEPTGATAAPAEEPEPGASAAEDGRAEAQRQERERSDQDAAIHQEMRRINIKMYMTHWCPVCTKARVWLAANGYRFTEYDVDSDSRARRKQRRLNPKGSVPTLDIDGKVLTGFSAQKIERVLRSRARRRLRL